MPRFYRTASAMPIDYMYRQNTPLMERVLLKNDQYIDENLATLGQVGDAAANFNYLTPDSADAKRIVENYDKQINEVAEAIKKDPAAWRNQSGRVKSIADDLKKSYKVGEIAKIAGNYGRYKEASDYIDKQVESYNQGKGGISAEEGQAFKSHFLSNFSGTKYDPATGMGKSINAWNPGQTINIEKFLGEELDKIKADKNAWRKDTVSGDEKYFDTDKGSWEGVTPERLLKIVMQRTKNPILQNYLKERAGINLIQNPFDAQGNMINPFDILQHETTPDQLKNMNTLQGYIDREKNPQRKASLVKSLDEYKAKVQNANRELSWTNPDGSDRSILSPAMRAIIAKDAYSQTTDEDSMRNNTVWNTKFNAGEAARRQQAGFTHQDNLEKERRKFAGEQLDKKLLMDKYKHDNPHFKPSAKDGKDKDKKDPTEELDVESSVSRMLFNNFENMTTTDEHGKTVKLYSAAGLNADLLNKKDKLLESQKRLDQLNNWLPKYDRSNPREAKLYEDLSVERADLMQRHNAMLADFNQSKQWRDQTLNAVLNNNQSALPKTGEKLTPTEVEMYKKYKDSDYGKKLRELVEANPTSTLEALFVLPSANKTIKDAQGGALGKQYKEYMKVVKKVEAGKDNFLKRVRSSQIDNDAINLGKKDSKAVTDMIFADTKGMELLDQDGEGTSGMKVDRTGFVPFLGKDENLSLEGNGLQKYMAENNVTVAATKIGNGTKSGLVELQFNDPTGVLGKTPYYIKLTPHIKKAIATRLTHNNKDPEIQGLAASLTDDVANDIRDQLEKIPNYSDNVGESGELEPITTTIYADRGDTKLPLQVTRFSGVDGTHLEAKWYKDGKWEPLPFGVKKDLPGWFGGKEDLIKQLKEKGIIK